MTRDQRIAQAKVLLHPTMGAMTVDNVDEYDGVNYCLMDHGNPQGRVARVRQGADYDQLSMLAWGGRAVAERGGNCDDFAAAVCYLLHHNGYVGPIEHVQAPGHAFVVIDRDTARGINDVLAWTGDTFIIDYWLNCRPHSKKVETVHVKKDLLCDIPPFSYQRIESTITDVNQYVTDLTTQPGSWYAGFRATNRLQLKTRF